LPIRYIYQKLKDSEVIYMSVSGVSSVTAANTPPPVQQSQPTKVPQQAPKTDTVTISKQVQQMASDGDPTALEAQEGSAEKAGESARGKA
jgi:hypothetical protein